MSEKKFVVTKDTFSTSVKTLDNLENDTIWREIAKDYFNEIPEQITEKLEELRAKILELGKES